jgi:hypothetical protein
MGRVVRAIPALLLIASISTLLWSRGGETLPLYAARTGNLCQTCHFDPNGGGPRNEFGFTFARNRHSLEAEPEGSPWGDLNLTNRIGENMPVYIGVNHRLMMLTNTSPVDSDSLARFGFFNMENSLHVAFQPHPHLTLVYSRDGFNSGAKTQDAFGMIGLPWNAYLKAGRFRNPFGLRLDDHTVATRHSFLDFSTDDGFLPYDPRDSDTGLEFGMVSGSLYGRAALTNGDANLFAGQFAETKSIKVGYNAPWYQGGLSFYDNYQKEPLATRKRSTRWGYYALSHTGPLAILGEVAAGTDEDEPVIPGAVTGPKTNRLAFFGELDYALSRAVNLRVRYDHLELDRSSNDAIRDANTHDRYALEGEFVPVPFAEIRWTLRRIDHKDETAFNSEDENQAYVQFHFSY